MATLADARGPRLPDVTLPRGAFSPTPGGPRQGQSGPFAASTPVPQNPVCPGVLSFHPVLTG